MRGAAARSAGRISCGRQAGGAAAPRRCRTERGQAGKRDGSGKRRRHRVRTKVALALQRRLLALGQTKILLHGAQLGFLLMGRAGHFRMPAVHWAAAAAAGSLLVGGMRSRACAWYFSCRTLSFSESEEVAESCAGLGTAASELK